MKKFILALIVISSIAPAFSAGIMAATSKDKPLIGFYFYGKHYNNVDELYAEQAKSIFTSYKLPWHAQDLFSSNMSVIGSGTDQNLNRKYVEIKATNDGNIKDVNGQKAAYEIGRFAVECKDNSLKQYALLDTKVYDNEGKFLKKYYGSMGKDMLAFYYYKPTNNKTNSFGEVLEINGCKTK